MSVRLGHKPPRLAERVTRGEALALLRCAFANAGLETPDLDARLLLTHALGLDEIEIVVRPDIAIGVAAGERLAEIEKRRLAGEPVGRILGRREFWGLSFDLSPETLEPRPDTETVVETALSFIGDRQAQLRLLDLGTGSGCLLVALLHELPRATGIGVDRSPGAVATARRNAVGNGLDRRAAFIVSDWTAPLRGRFEIIVSNPPYIPTPDLAELPPEVRDHDPPAALDGGADGLAAYRTILAAALDLLAPKGLLVVEIGGTQEGAIRGLAAVAGLEVVRVSIDLGGNPRAVALRPLAFDDRHGRMPGSPI